MGFALTAAGIPSELSSGITWLAQAILADIRKYNKS